MDTRKIARELIRLAREVGGLPANFPRRFYAGQQVFVVEGRKPDGSLDVKNEPPFLYATMRQLFDYYFRKHPQADKAAQEEILKWYNSKGWYYRPKTW